MRFADIKNQPVVSLAGAEKLGVVADLLMDVDTQTITGFRVRRGGLIGHHEAVRLADVKAIGRDALTIEDPGKLNAGSNIADLQNSVPGGDVVGCRVMTEHGHLLGNVADVDADFATGKVLGYIVVGGLLERIRGQQAVIAAGMVVSIGKDLMVVQNAAAPES